MTLTRAKEILGPGYTDQQAAALVKGLEGLARIRCEQLARDVNDFIEWKTRRTDAINGVSTISTTRRSHGR